jgi:F-type H+-transporting ATPase subunit b
LKKFPLRAPVAAGWLVVLGLVAAVSVFPQEHPPSPNEEPAGHSASPGADPHADSAVKHGEAHEEAQMPNEIWWKWANFAILFGGLGFLIGKNAGPFFKARTASIQQGITEASQMKADAETRARMIEGRIGSLAADVEAMRLRSKEEIAAESARLEAETAQQLAKIQKQAEAEIASAAKHASADLKAYSASLAMELAEQQIQARMNPETQHNLAEAFVDDLRANSPGAVQ